MRWFYLSEFGELSKYNSSRDKSINNVICRPLKYEGVAYGTYNNPYYKVHIEAKPQRFEASGRNEANIFLYYNSTNSRRTASYASTSSGIFKYTMDWGMRLWGSIDDEDLSCDYTSPVVLKITEYNNVTLSGRYRSKQTITPSKMNFYVPIDFYVNGVKYNFIGNNSTLTTADGTSNDTVIGVEENGNIQTTLLTTSTSSETLANNFQNVVFDFGLGTDVPSFLKEWLDENFDYIYPNTFEVKSEDGSTTLATLEEAPAMVSGFLNITGNSKTLTLTGINDETYTLQWESETPEDKAFLGLAFEPTNIVANIPIGIETYFTIDGDFSFYECYGKYKPVQTTFQVILYQNKSEQYRVDKSDYLTAIKTLNGALREDTSITDLSITFEMETVPDFNYIYIPIFNRYYFVNDIRSIRYKIWEISASVDVLMSYKDAILNCVGFIDRNQLEFNSDIIDKKRVVELGHTIEVNSVTNELFTSTMGTYVLNGLLVSYVTEE